MLQIFGANSKIILVILCVYYWKINAEEDQSDSKSDSRYMQDFGHKEPSHVTRYQEHLLRDSSVHKSNDENDSDKIDTDKKRSKHKNLKSPKKHYVYEKTNKDFVFESNEKHDMRSDKKDTNKNKHKMKKSSKSGDTNNNKIDERLYMHSGDKKETEEDTIILSLYEDQKKKYKPQPTRQITKNIDDHNERSRLNKAHSISDTSSDEETSSDEIQNTNHKASKDKNHGADKHHSSVVKHGMNKHHSSHKKYAMNKGNNHSENAIKDLDEYKDRHIDTHHSKYATTKKDQSIEKLHSINKYHSMEKHHSKEKQHSKDKYHSKDKQFNLDKPHSVDKYDSLYKNHSVDNDHNTDDDQSVDEDDSIDEHYNSIEKLNSVDKNQKKYEDSTEKYHDEYNQSIHKNLYTSSVSPLLDSTSKKHKNNESEKNKNNNDYKNKNTHRGDKWIDNKKDQAVRTPPKEPKFIGQVDNKNILRSTKMPFEDAAKLEKHEKKSSYVKQSKYLRAHSLTMQLKQLEKTLFKDRFPDANFTIEKMGRTAEYNDIILLKITDRKTDKDMYFRTQSKFVDETPEKKIIFIVHGLSVMGTSYIKCLNYIPDMMLLMSYYLKHLNKFDIFIMPMANPDGYTAAVTKQSLLWNKNMSPQDACSGVALDRNFDVAWNGSRNVTSCSQLYPGPAPFSEIETRVVRDVLHYFGQRIIAYINVHAGTFDHTSFKGDAILYPKGYSDSQTNEDRYIDLRGEIEEAMRNASFQVMSVTVDTIRNWYGKVSGTSVDYASTVYGIPYALEFVMQVYDENEEEAYQQLALIEIWSRLVDTTLKHIWKNRNRDFDMKK